MGGEGGYPSNPRFSRNETRSNPACRARGQVFLADLVSPKPRDTRVPCIRDCCWSLFLRLVGAASSGVRDSPTQGMAAERCSAGQPKAAVPTQANANAGCYFSETRFFTNPNVRFPTSSTCLGQALSPRTRPGWSSLGNKLTIGWPFFCSVFRTGTRYGLTWALTLIT